MKKISIYLALLLCFVALYVFLFENENKETASQAYVPNCRAVEDSSGGMVKNGSFENCASENPFGWSGGSWGGSDIQFVYPAEGESGNGAKIVVSNYKDGDAKWRFDPVEADPSAVYEYKESYRSSSETEIDVYYYHSNGEKTYGMLLKVPKSELWKNISKTFTLPPDTEKIEVQHILKSDGILSIDNVSLHAVSVGDETGHGSISIQFDDGWKSQYTEALPILLDEGISATFYVIEAPLAGKWSDYMTPEEVKDLNSRGFDIEGHTVSHARLSTLSPDELEKELVKSKKYIENLIGEDVQSLAYPYGDYNDEVMKVAEEAGYRTGRTTTLGVNNRETNAYALRAYSLESSTELSDVKHWIDRANKTDTWLIIVFHQIGKPGGLYNVSPDYLRAVIEYAKSKGMRFGTVSEGYQNLR